MRIADALEVIDEHLRQAKEDWVADHHDKPDPKDTTYDGHKHLDIPMMLFAYRGEHLVAKIFLDRIDVDVLLRCAELSVSLFQPDILVTTSEGYRPNYEDFPTFPLTGQSWDDMRSQRGSFQDLVENQDARRKGWIVDELSAFAANRSGDVGTTSNSYRIEGDKVIWTRNTHATSLEGANLGGRIPHTLVRAMTYTTLGTTLTRAGMQTFHLSGEQTQAHLDVVATRTLLAQGASAVLLLGEDGGARGPIITSSFPDAETFTEGEPPGSAFFKSD